MAEKSPQIGKKVNKASNIEWKVADGEAAAPWERQPDEPIRWFAVFELYRLLGPRRTLEDAWRKNREQAGNPPHRGLRRDHNFHRVAHLWNWQERAAAWDVAEIQRVRREFFEEAKRDKAERIKLLKSARGKLIQALPNVDVTSIRLDSLINAIRMIVVELRSEYGDNTYQPDDLTEEEVDVAIEEALAELASRKESPIPTEPAI